MSGDTKASVTHWGRSCTIGMTAAALLCGLYTSTGPARADEAVARKQVWFGPGPATPDLLELFQSGTQWADARERLAVFKFYQQHLMTPAPPIVEGNTYTALRDVQAFRRLTVGWHKRTAIEVGAVKRQYCSSDGSAEANAIRDTVDAIGAVEAAGGRVSLLAMDQPF